MLTFSGSYSGSDTDIRSCHSYSNCWAVVGHWPTGHYFPSFQRCINWGLESKITLRSFWWSVSDLGSKCCLSDSSLSSCSRSISTVLLPSALRLASIPNYLFLFFRLDHESLQVSILFTDRDCRLQSSANFTCLCFLRSCYINWHKSTFSQNLLLFIFLKFLFLC